jgi:hypothetical protein
MVAEINNRSLTYVTAQRALAQNNFLATTYNRKAPGVQELFQ